MTNKGAKLKRQIHGVKPLGEVRGSELVFKDRQTEREFPCRENFKRRFGFWDKSWVCVFHTIRGYQGLFESSVMLSAPPETLDTKESQLIPRLNVWCMSKEPGSSPQLILQSSPSLLYFVLFWSVKTSAATTEPVITVTILIIVSIDSSNTACHHCQSLLH